MRILKENQINLIFNIKFAYILKSHSITTYLSKMKEILEHITPIKEKITNDDFAAVFTLSKSWIAQAQELFFNTKDFESQLSLFQSQLIKVKTDNSLSPEEIVSLKNDIRSGLLSTVSDFGMYLEKGFKTKRENNKKEEFNEKLKVANEILRALAHPFRMQLLKYIDDNQSIHLGKIYQDVNLDKLITHQHLRILRVANIVIAERKGEDIYFSINYPKLEKTVGAVDKFLEQGQL